MPYLMPMLNRRIPRWVLPAALGGVLAMAGADAVLMRRHKVSIRPAAIREGIGLHADAVGEGLRVQWDSAIGSRPTTGTILGSTVARRKIGRGFGSNSARPRISKSGSLVESGPLSSALRDY